MEQKTPIYPKYNKQKLKECHKTDRGKMYIQENKTKISENISLKTK